MRRNDFGNTNDVEAAGDTSRRGFLTRGAATLLGATASGLVSWNAIAGHDQGGGVHQPNGQALAVRHYSSQNFVNVVLEAWRTWNDPGGYKSRLLDPGTTNSALAQFNVSGQNTVVLTEAQYSQGYHQANVSEIVYVLPNPPVGGNLTGQTARNMMAAVPFGM